MIKLIKNTSFYDIYHEMKAFIPSPTPLTTALFQSAIGAGLSMAATTLLTARSLNKDGFPSSMLYTVGAITSLALGALQLYKHSKKLQNSNSGFKSQLLNQCPLTDLAESQQSAQSRRLRFKPRIKATKQELILSESIMQKKPIGFVNVGGNDCCFISALQVLFNTPSWTRSLLENPVIHPAAESYRKASLKAEKKSLKFNLSQIRKGIEIYEENHFKNQEDPAAYICALGAEANKLLSMKASYITSDGEEISRGVLPPDDSIIRLGITKTNEPLNLNKLLQDYFCESFSGVFSKEEDKLIEKENNSTQIKKSFAGKPPEDLLIQIKRFGIEKPQPNTPSIKSSKILTLDWFKWLSNWIYKLFFDRTPHSSLSQEHKDYKIQDPIEVPLILDMDKEWFDGEQSPLRYECQGFLCHRGDQIRSGHYTAYVKRDNTWYECNDSVVNAISEERAKEELKQSYILSYRKVC